MKRPSPPETGSDTLSETPPCTHRIRSTNPTPLGPAHETQQLSQPMVVVDSLVLIHLSPRIDHKICMVINRLNHQRHPDVWSSFWNVTWKIEKFFFGRSVAPTSHGHHCSSKLEKYFKAGSG